MGGSVGQEKIVASRNENTCRNVCVCVCMCVFVLMSLGGLMVTYMTHFFMINSLKAHLEIEKSLDMIIRPNIESIGGEKECEIIVSYIVI